MTKIYITRHGESVANTEGIYQGQTYNTDLSPLGKKQAKQLANLFKNIHLDRIIASPLKRTYQTAKNVADVKKMELIIKPIVMETNHGEWEGKHKEDIAKQWPDIYAQWQEHPAKTGFPKGETFMQTRERIIEWLGDALAFDGDTLLVTHDNIVRIIIAEILKMDLDAIWELDLNPAGVTEIEITGKDVKMNYINNIDHLKGLTNNIALHAL
ncbi:MAG: histidine phosphatase family protein [Microgenomates group bacterium]